MSNILIKKFKLYFRTHKVLLKLVMHMVPYLGERGECGHSQEMRKEDLEQGNTNVWQGTCDKLPTNVLVTIWHRLSQLLRPVEAL